MRDIQAKTDNVGDTLAAGAFNSNLKTELQALATDTGQTLDPEAGPDTDQDMLGKALSVYASDGGFYTDSGAADAYVIARVGNLQPVPAYFDGMQIVYVAGNTNTGASTVNASTLGAKDIRRIGGAVLSAGDIAAGDYIICRFDNANDYFELVGFVPLASTTVAGKVEIATAGEAQAGADPNKMITPVNLQTVTATETRKGIAETATQAETNTGTNDITMVTPKKLFGAGAASIVANGYIKFPSWLFGGFIIQWATTSEDSTPTARNFPTPFLNTVFGLVATVNAAGTEYVTSARSLSLTQYEIDTSAATAKNTFMIAFGN